MRPVPAWLTRTPVAHRGLHDAAKGVPENTLAAFRAAIEAGYAIELDLQLSSDGEAIVFHDDGLERLAGVTGQMADRTAAELARLPVLGTAETIPSFTRVLEAVDGRTPLLIELKTLDRTVGPLERATLAALDGYPGPFAVQSFEPATVLWFRRHAPKLCRGQISGDSQLALPELACRVARILRGRPDFIAFNIDRLPNPAVALARRLGWPALTWTVRTEAQHRKARALADNVIFEQIRPDV